MSCAVFLSFTTTTTTTPPPPPAATATTTTTTTTTTSLFVSKYHDFYMSYLTVVILIPLLFFIG